MSLLFVLAKRWKKEKPIYEITCIDISMFSHPFYAEEDEKKRTIQRIKIRRKLCCDGTHLLCNFIQFIKQCQCIVLVTMIIIFCCLPFSPCYCHCVLLPHQCHAFSLPANLSSIWDSNCTWRTDATINKTPSLSSLNNNKSWKVKKTWKILLLFWRCFRLCYQVNT